MIEDINMKPARIVHVLLISKKQTSKKMYNISNGENQLFSFQTGDKGVQSGVVQHVFKTHSPWPAFQKVLFHLIHRSSFK